MPGIENNVNDVTQEETKVNGTHTHVIEVGPHKFATMEEIKVQEEPAKDPEEKTNPEKEEKPEEIKKYSDAEVDEIIKKKLAKKEAQIEEAKKLAKMNAEEKLSYERDKYKQQLDELLEKQTLSEMKSEARTMLANEGINLDEDLLSALVTKDAEETKKNINTFSSLFKKAVEIGVNEALKGKTPSRAGSNNSMTKEEIMKVIDPVKRQKLILENLDLFQ